MPIMVAPSEPHASTPAVDEPDNRPTHKLSASCTVCGAKFVQISSDTPAMIAAYKEWDKNHSGGRC